MIHVVLVLNAGTKLKSDECFCLKKIGRFAFQGCDNIKEITIPTSVREIGQDAFRSSGIEKLVIKDMAAWCGVKKTGGFINSNTKVFLNEEEIKDLVVPDGVTIIEPNTFNGFKSIETVYIPESVDSIGDNAFQIGRAHV